MINEPHRKHTHIFRYLRFQVRLDIKVTLIPFYRAACNADAVL